MHVLLAQAAPPGTSFLGWIVSALTTFSSLFILVTAALIFFGACYLVAKKRPVASLAAYLLLLPAPLLAAVCGWIYSSIGSLLAIATTPDLAITNQDIARGLATSLLSVLFAILVSMPTYLVLAYGLIARDFRAPSQGAESANSAAKSATPGPVEARLGRPRTT
jgi:hypothetical protein